MKAALILGLLLFAAIVLLAIAQLWMSPLSAWLFVRLEITLGALWAIAVAAWYVIRESRAYKDLRSSNRLDQ